MALFTPQYYGKPISTQLSEYLKVYTSSKDRTEVSRSSGVSVSTLRDIIYSGNSISEKNAPAMLTLMKIAVRNCTKSIEKAKEFQVYYEEVTA